MPFDNIKVDAITRRLVKFGKYWAARPKRGVKMGTNFVALFRLLIQEWF